MNSEEVGSVDGGEIEGLIQWQPYNYLRVLSADRANYSGGFLSSRPQKWFPSIAAQWLPLTMSLGVEVRLQDVEPDLVPPQNLGTTYVGEFGGEVVGITFERETESLIAEHVIANSTGISRSILIEYMARRLFSSLALSWSGPQSDDLTVFRGISSEPTYQFLKSQVGGIKIKLTVDDREVVVWISLGRKLVDQIDGLWKRQQRSATRTFREGASIEFEVARIGVPVGEVQNFLQSGVVVELETPVDDKVLVRSAGKPWAIGRLCIIGDYFGVELLSRTVPEDISYDDIEIVSVRFTQISMDTTGLAELAQIGAILPTLIPVSGEVELVVSGRVVAKALLADYQGGFAVTVL